MEVAAANPDAWAVGFEDDECWWSRLALPTVSSWADEGKPLRLVQQSVAANDPEPKAVSSCYGLYLPELDETWLRFVEGRPVSSITTRILEWCSERLEAAGKKVVVLISGTTLPGTSPGGSGAGSGSTTEKSKRAAME